MAEKKIIYSIKINGIEQETKNVQSLNSSIKNLGDSINEFDTGNITAGGENIENLNLTIGETTDKFNEAGQSVQNFDVNLDNIDPTPLNIVNKNLDSTTEKVDKLTFAGEKGFKGLSDALKLFGIDTSILDNVKEGLGAIGDLLDSQSKLNDVAYNAAPAAKQAETIQELAKAQTVSNTATNAGTVATTASSTATKGATIATHAFNVALRALPFLAVIGAITTVIALYSQWKDKQEEVKQTFDDFLNNLNTGLDEYNSKLENQVQILENIADANLTNIDSQISGLEKQIELLEAQGGKESEIFELKKDIIQLQQQQLQAQIDLNNNLVNTSGQQLQNNQNLINSLQEEIDLRNQSLDLRVKGARSDEDRKKIQDEINQLQEKISDIEKQNNDLLQKKSDLLIQNLSLSNKLTVSKQFDVKILSETNKLEAERLRLQKEQEKIKLSEELKKIGFEIFKNYINLRDFNEEFLRLYNELEQSVNKDKLKIAIDSKDFNQAFDLLKKSLDNFTFELKNKKQDITKNLISPLKDYKSALLDLRNQTKEELIVRLKLQGVQEKDIESTIRNIEEKLEQLSIDISSSLRFDLPSDFQIKLSDFISKSDLDSIDNLPKKLINVREKVKNGLTDFTAEEFFLIDIDKIAKNYNITDGLLNGAVQDFLSYQIEIKKSSQKIRKELNEEFKIKGFDQKNIDSLNQFINSLISSDEKISIVNSKILENLNNSEVIQSSQLKVFGEKIKETSDLLKNAEGNFDESLGNIQNIVEGNLKGLQDKFDNGGNLNFKLFLNQDLRQQLKVTLSEPVQMVIDDLQKKKDELKAIFEGIIQNNPEAGEALKQQLQQLLNQIDAAIANLNGKVKENNSKVDSTFKEFTKKYGDTIKDTIQAAADLYTAINDLQIQALENQQKEIDDFYDNQAEIYDSEIERIQQFYDLQSQIASDSLSKINDFENQLQSARGARAEFLLKLIAAEQVKNQAAEKQKADALKREEKLKKDAAKAEEERAAKQEAIERRKFQLQKASNIAQIIVNGALAVTQALSSPPGPPSTIPLAVIVGALSAFQLGVAASAKFEKGGLFELGGQLTGKSHAQGGMAVLNDEGKKVAELEGGEYIINKKSTSNPLNKEILEKINNDPNFFDKKIIIDRFGKNNKFELGGVFNTIKQASSRTPDFGQIINSIQVAKQVPGNNIANNNIVANVDTGAITNAIVEGMSNVTIQASILDIIEKNNKQIEIDTLRRI